MGFLYSKLGLTDQQKAEIKTIMQTNGPQFKTLHQQLFTNSSKLRQTQPNDPNLQQCGVAGHRGERHPAPADRHIEGQRSAGDFREIDVRAAGPSCRRWKRRWLRATPRGGPRGAGAPPPAT
jgi:hypothetical protein